MCMTCVCVFACVYHSLSRSISVLGYWKYIRCMWMNMAIRSMKMIIVKTTVCYNVSLVDWTWGAWQLNVLAGADTQDWILKKCKLTKTSVGQSLSVNYVCVCVWPRSSSELNLDTILLNVSCFNWFSCFLC